MYSHTEPGKENFEIIKIQKKKKKEKIMLESRIGGNLKMP